MAKFSSTQVAQRKGARQMGKRAIIHMDFALHNAENGKIQTRAARFAEYSYNAKQYAREAAHLAFMSDPSLRDQQDETQVVFRKFPDGDVIAIFPYVASTAGRPEMCESYMHIGQHSSCDPSALTRSLKPATFTEYTALYRELQSLGYSLKVIKRIPYGAYIERKRQLKLI